MGMKLVKKITFLFLFLFLWIWYLVFLYCLGLIGVVLNEGTAKQNSRARSYTFRELAAATQNFKPTNLIGVGGFGSVFKGRVDSGQVNCVFINFLLLL